MRWIARLTGVVLALGLSPSLAVATTYYADPAGGGAASCVDTGANVCTLVRAEAVATHGDTVQAACGTYDLAASTLTINVNITIAPVTAGCAIITSTNATSVVTLTVANDANVLTFGAFDVQNTGGATSSTMVVSNVAYDQVVVLNGTRITVGGTNRHLVDQYTRGTLKLVDVTMSGLIGAQAGFYSVVTPSAAKKLSITGGTFTFTTTAGTTYGILVERAAGSSTSEWVYVANTSVAVTVPEGLGASASGIGIRLNRITTGTDLNGNATAPIVEDNTVTVTSLGVTAADSFGIVASSTDATAVADNVIIRDNTVTCNGPATRCVTIGTDPNTAFFAANARITGNTVTGPYYNGAATPHGIACGRVTNCTIASNTVRGFAAGILTSRSTLATVAGNLVVGATYAPLFAKGNTSATFANNTVIMDDDFYGAQFGTYGCLGVAIQGATNNAATTYVNNLCVVQNGTGWKHVVVDTSQVASFDNNNYFSTPTLTTPWSYQATTYATLALWNAVATVGTDLEADPRLLSTTDYRTRGDSTMRRLGLSNYPCIDVRQRPCWTPPDIGAYQASSGDPRAN